VAKRKESERALSVSIHQHDPGATVMPFGQHRNKPIRAIDVGYLNWVLTSTDAVEKRPALKADIEAWLQRRAEQKEHAEDRDPRQAEWDRNARTLAETDAARERRKTDPVWAAQQDAARDEFFRRWRTA
jgi:hypothetical protein